MDKLREGCKESLQPVVGCIISLTLMQHHQAKQCRNLEVLSVGPKKYGMESPKALAQNNVFPPFQIISRFDFFDISILSYI
jgi:hypothetical protein